MIIRFETTDSRSSSAPDAAFEPLGSPDRTPALSSAAALEREKDLGTRFHADLPAEPVDASELYAVVAPARSPLRQFGVWVDRPAEVRDATTDWPDGEPVLRASDAVRIDADVLYDYKRFVEKLYLQYNVLFRSDAVERAPNAWRAASAWRRQIVACYASGSFVSAASDRLDWRRDWEASLSRLVPARAIASVERDPGSRPVDKILVRFAAAGEPSGERPAFAADADASGRSLATTAATLFDYDAFFSECHRARLPFSHEGVEACADEAEGRATWFDHVRETLRSRSVLVRGLFSW